MPPHRKRAPWPLRLLRVAGLLAVAVGVAWIFRRELFERAIASRIETALSDSLGGTWSVATVEGGWVSDAVVTGVRLTAPDEGGTVRAASAERIEVEFDTWRVLGGARALTAVRASGLEADVDLAGHGPARKEPSRTAGGTFLDDLPDGLREIAVDARLTVRGATAEPFVGRVRVAGDPHGVDLTVDDLTSEFGVDASGWRARIDRDGSRLTLSSAVALGDVDVRSLSIDLAADAPQLAGEAAVAGGTVRLDATREATRLEARELDLPRLPAWLLAVVGLPTPQSGAGDGELTASADGTKVLTVRVRGLDIAGLPEFGGEATFDLARRPIVATSFAMDLAVAQVSGKDAVLDPADPWRIASCAELQVDSDDALAALRVFGVEPPELPVEGPVRLSAALTRWTNGDVHVIEADVDAGRTHSVWHGEVRLAATPKDLRDSRITIDGELRETLDPESSERRFGVALEGAATADVRVIGRAGSPRIEFHADAPELRVDASRPMSIRTAGQVVDGKVYGSALVERPEGSLDARANYDPATRVVAATLEIAAPDVAALLGDSAPGVEITGGAKANVTVTHAVVPGRGAPRDAWFDGLTATFRVVGDGLAVDGVRIQELTAKGRIAGPAAAVEELLARGDPVLVTGKGSVDLRDAAIRDVLAVVAVSDAEALPPRWTGGERLSGAGVVVVRAPRVAGGLAELEGLDLQANFDDAGVAGADLGTGKVEARVADGRLRVTGSAATTDADARVSALIVPEGDDGLAVHVEELLAHLSGREVTLTAPAEALVSDGGVMVPDARLRIAGAPVRVSGSFGGTTTLRANATGLDLHPLLDAIDGVASVDVEYRDDGGVRSVRLHADVEGVRAAGAEVEGVSGSLHVDAAEDARGIRVREATFDGAAGGALSRSGRIDPSAGPGVRAPELNRPADGHVKASGLFPWRWESGGFVRAAPGAPEVSLSFRTSAVSEWLRSLGVDGFDAPTLDATVRIADGRAHVEADAPGVAWTPLGGEGFAVTGALVLRADADGDAVSLSVDGASDAGSTAKAEIRVGGGVDWSDLAATFDRLRAAPLAGEVVLDVPDLAARRKDVPALATLAGRIAARVTVGGTIDAPTMHGSAEVRDVALRPVRSPLSFDRVAAALTFAGREIRLDRLDGRLGFGEFHAEGTVGLPSGASPAVDLKVRGENVLLAQDDLARVRADPDLVVSGPLDALTVRGTVRLRDTLVEVAFDNATTASSQGGDVELFSLGEGFLGGAKLDVKVTSDDTVRIAGERLRGTASVDLRLRGTGLHPEPEGRIEFPGLRVLLPFTLLEVESGTVEFPRDRPFTPRVRIVASCNARGYDVTVRLAGTSPELDLSVASVPALTREQALVLLATGSSPDDVEHGGVGGIALSRAGSMFASELLSQVGRPIEAGERSFLDDLTFETTASTQRGESTSYEASYRLDEDVSIRVERDRFSEYVFGVVWRVRFR